MHADRSNKLCLTELSDFDPTLADLIRGINGAIGFRLLRVNYGIFMGT